MKDIFAEIEAERERQIAKFGVQRLPSVPRDAMQRKERALEPWLKDTLGILSGFYCRDFCRFAEESGELTHAHITLEEMSEAIDAAIQGDRVALRTELIQTATVLIAWIESLDAHAPVISPEKMILDYAFCHLLDDRK